MRSVSDELRATLLEYVFTERQLRACTACVWMSVDRRGGADAVLEVDRDVTIRDLVRMERVVLPKAVNFSRGELGVRIRMQWDYIPYWVKDRDDYAARR